MSGASSPVEVAGPRAVIVKSAADDPRPNLVDYDAARAGFDWAAESARLDRAGTGLVNIAHEAVTRWAASERAEHPALRLLGTGGTNATVTYRELDRLSNRFAAMLTASGIQRGDSVFVALPRTLSLYVAALGIWKAGAVFSPLFTAFGPEPVRQRLQIGEAAAIVTTPRLYRRRVEPIRAEVPTLRSVLCVQVDGDPPEGTVDADALAAAMADSAVMADTGPDDPAIVHFTSGTTGRPKGALHVHGAVVAHRSTAEQALDLHPDDVFWCTADPGWVTGTSYGIIAPLSLGVTVVVDEGDFDAQRWYGVLADERVSVWYTAPTAIRMMMRLGAEAARAVELPSLRFIASVGEPLAADAVSWGVDAFGLPIHDNWWQTETGGIMVANYASQPIRPGSMGRPVPGIDTALLAMTDAGDVELDEEDRPRVLTGDGVEGMLAIRVGWPSMFRTYLGEEARYRSCFVGDEGQWYVSGDIVSRDAEGYLWFVSRADDVIKSAGHLIGPFEVESALTEHPAVAAAGVFGKPDAIAGAVVKAVVVLRDGHEPSDDLRRELLGHARRKLGPAVAPREIDFAASLPLTRSGKIMRRLLRARELGLAEGDLSMLEPTT